MVLFHCEFHSSDRKNIVGPQLLLIALWHYSKLLYHWDTVLSVWAEFTQDVDKLKWETKSNGRDMKIHTFLKDIDGVTFICTSFHVLKHNKSSCVNNKITWTWNEAFTLLAKRDIIVRLSFLARKLSGVAPLPQQNKLLSLKLIYQTF